MKKIFSIVIISLSLMYGPGFIARAIENNQEKKAADIIWEMYCKDRGIDPEHPTTEQENEYLDVYMETDEYAELYEFLTK